LNSVSAFQNLGYGTVTNYAGMWQPNNGGSMGWIAGDTGNSTGIWIVGPYGTSLHESYAYAEGEWTPNLSSCSAIIVYIDLGAGRVSAGVSHEIRVRIWPGTDTSVTPLTDSYLSAGNKQAAWDLNSQYIGGNAFDCNNVGGTHAVRIDAVGAGSPVIPESAFKSLRIWGNCNGGINQTCSTFGWADFSYTSTTPLQHSMTWCFDNQDDSGYQQDVEDAANVWTYYTQPYFGFVFTGNCNGNLSDHGDVTSFTSCDTEATWDGVNEIRVIEDSGWTNIWAATAVSANCLTGEMYEADVWINAYFSPNVFTSTLHELAHVMGLSDCVRHTDNFSPCAPGKSAEPDDATVGIVDPCDAQTGEGDSVLCYNPPSLPSSDDVAGAKFIYADLDGDKCTGMEEYKLGADWMSDSHWYDFYSVPVPALYAANDPTTVFADDVVSAGDVQAVFGYFQHGAHAGDGSYYDQDLNQNGIADGIEYDRSLVNGHVGPPDGVIGATDAQLVYAQFLAAFKCNKGP